MDKYIKALKKELSREKKEFKELEANAKNTNLRLPSGWYESHQGICSGINRCIEILKEIDKSE